MGCTDPCTEIGVRDAPQAECRESLCTLSFSVRGRFYPDGAENCAQKKDLLTKFHPKTVIQVKEELKTMFIYMPRMLVLKKVKI